MRKLTWLFSIALAFSAVAVADEGHHRVGIVEGIISVLGLACPRERG